MSIRATLRQRVNARNHEINAMFLVVVKAMKAAKTGQEILAAPGPCSARATKRAPKSPPDAHGVDHKVEMLHTFAQNQLTQLLDRGSGIPVPGPGGHVHHGQPLGRRCRACNAKAAGASDDEIMEVALLRLLLRWQSQDAGERSVPRQGLLQPDLPGHHPQEEDIFG